MALQASTSILQFYDGKVILLTGATGFLGKVVLEKILWDCTGPDCGSNGGPTVKLLVRPLAGTAASLRLQQLFDSPVFDRLRKRHGPGFQTFVDSTVSLLEGDLEEENLGLTTQELRQLSQAIDVIIHSAALVKWASPLDASMKANAIGTQRIAKLASMSFEAGKVISLVIISTAWVHGRKKGICHEELVTSTVTGFDPAYEVELSLKEAAKVESESKTAAKHADFLRQSKQRLGPGASSPELSSMCEDMRRRWVEYEMIRWGQDRALEWGWNDCYTFSKVVGEQLAATVLKDIMPFAIVRPSGIVAASKEPFVGWIDAYLLVEPLIEGVGKGQITSFPGDPACVIDTVPVDFVCNAILSAAARMPSSKGAHVYQCASGDICAHTLGTIEKTWLNYFAKDPMLDANGKLPKLKSISYHKNLEEFEAGIQRTYITPLKACARTLELVPAWNRSAQLRSARGWLVKKARVLEKVLELARLYSAYTLNEWNFQTGNTRTMMALLSAEDQHRFSYFPAGHDASEQSNWDWGKFWTEVHIPGMRHWVLKDKPYPPMQHLMSKL